MAKYGFRIIFQNNGDATGGGKDAIDAGGIGFVAIGSGNHPDNLGEGNVITNWPAANDTYDNDHFYFIDTEEDGLNLSSSAVWDRIRGMKMMGSYDIDVLDNINFTGSAAGTDMGTAILRNINLNFGEGYMAGGNGLSWLSASLHASKDTDPTADLTGSVRFYSDTGSNSAGTIRRYKFLGEKVCNVLGLPHNMWLYPDTVKIPSTGSQETYISGDVSTDYINVRRGLTLSNIASVNSDMNFHINAGRNNTGTSPTTGSTDRWLKFINTNTSDSHTNPGGLPENNVVFGYNAASGAYELKGGIDGGIQAPRTFQISASSLYLSSMGGTGGGSLALHCDGGAKFDSALTMSSALVTGHLYGDGATDLNNFDNIWCDQVGDKDATGNYIEFPGTEGYVYLKLGGVLAGFWSPQGYSQQGNDASGNITGHQIIARDGFSFPYAFMVRNQSMNYDISMSYNPSDFGKVVIGSTSDPDTAGVTLRVSGSVPLGLSTPNNDQIIFSKKGGNTTPHTFIDRGNFDDSGTYNGFRFYNGNGGTTGTTCEIKPTGEVVANKLTHLSKPAFSCRLSSDFYMTAGVKNTDTELGNARWTEIYDNGSNFDTTTGRFTAPYDGIYHFNCMINWYGVDSNDTEIYVYIRNNTGTLAFGNMKDNNGTSEENEMEGLSRGVTIDMKLDAGDTVSVWYQLSSDGTITDTYFERNMPGSTATGTEYGSWFSGHLIPPV